MKTGFLYLPVLLALAALPVAAQTVFVDRSNQIPGGQVVVSATGLPRTELSADILLDGTRVNLAAVEDGKVAPRSVTIPAAAEPGPHVIGVLGRNSGAIGEATIQVTVNWLQPGYDAANSKTNSLERIISAETAGDLVLERRLPVGDLRHDPIIYARNAYLVTADGKVRCIDLNTWRTRWTRSLHARALAVSSRGRVFVATGEGSLKSLDYLTGAVRQTYRPPVGPAGSLKVLGAELYYYSSSGLYVFDVADIRKPRWVDHDVARPLEGGEIVADWAGIIVSDLVSVMRVEPSKGISWRVRTYDGYRVSSLGLAAGRISYLISRNANESLRLAELLDPDGSARHIIQTHLGDGGTLAGPAYYKSMIYLQETKPGLQGDRSLGVFDVDTGSGIVHGQGWGSGCDDLRFGRDFMFCATASDLNVYTLSGEALWRHSFSGNANFPVISDGRLFVEAGGLLYVFTPASRLNAAERSAAAARAEVSTPSTVTKP